MNRKPTFFWQGLLIVLPVLALAAVGVVSLWKDRETVTLEARRTAAQYGEQLAAFLGEELHPELQRVYEDDTIPAVGHVWGYGSTIDADGNLVGVGPGGAPGDYLRFPAAAPLRPQTLDARAADLWTAAESAERTDPAAALEAYEAFLETDPPEPFRANARYARAVLLAATGEHDAALDALRSLEETPETTETGLPLAVLANLRRVRLLAEAVRGDDPGARAALRSAVDDLGARAVERASFATASMLAAAAEYADGLDDESAARIRSYQRKWAADETTRAFYRSAGPFRRAGPDGERAFWTDWNGENRLVMLIPSGPQSADAGDRDLFEMQVYHESVVRSAVETLLAQAHTRPPEYLGAAVDLAGRPVSDRSADPDPIATVDGDWIVDGHSLGGLRVALRLVDPDRLYAQQRQRALWFGGLVVLAAAAALIGYAASRRAFHRQLRLNELKSNFVASVSHELRAPIASVRLMAEGLERGTVPDSEKQRGYYTFIVRECRRLSALIENVLDFSRIEQGRKEYEREPTDVAALVRHTADLMRPCALERRVRIETDIDPGLASDGSQPDLDGKAMQQALVNLIDNAVKHSPPDSAVVVGVRSGNDTGALLLSVEDRGEGIPAGEHSRIFERFYRIGSELRRETRGAGIGLSLVRHIVEGHGGKIHVKSKTGQGSRFTIEIPAAGSGLTQSRQAAKTVRRKDPK